MLVFDDDGNCYNQYRPREPNRLESKSKIEPEPDRSKMDPDEGYRSKMDPDEGYRSKIDPDEGYRSKIDPDEGYRSDDRSGKREGYRSRMEGNREDPEEESSGKVILSVDRSGIRGLAVEVVVVGTTSSFASTLEFVRIS